MAAGGGATLLFLPRPSVIGGSMTHKSILTFIAVTAVVISLSVAVCTMSSTESDAVTTVSDSTELLNAIENADTEKVEITLGSNITISDSIVIDGEKIIDINLNEHTLMFLGNIDSTQNAYMTIKQANVTFSGPGMVTSDSVTINMYGSTKGTTDYAILTVENDVTVSGTTAVLIDNGNNNNCGVKVNLSGTLETTDNSEAIVISKTSTRFISFTPTITVYSTGTIDGKDGIGIHSAGFGKWNVYGTVKGDVAAQLDSGRIYIYDHANIQGGNSFSAPNTTGESASSAKGIGILLSQNADYVSAEINDGTISGAYSLYEIDMDGDHNGISMKIAGGTFTGNVYSGSVVGFITGGNFSYDVSSYVSTTCRLDESADGTGYIVTPISSGAIRIGSTYFTSLADAVDNYKTGATIEFLDDVSTEPLDILRGINIDLNGHTLTITGGTQMIGVSFSNGLSKISNGFIVDGRSTDGSGGYTAMTVSTGSLTVSDVTLTIENASDDINANNIGFQVLSAGTLDLRGTSAIIANSTNGTYHSVGIIVDGNEETGVQTTLNIQDYVMISVGQFGISGNGGEGNGDTLISLSGNASVTASNGWGIYHPQTGILNISDNVSVVGMTGIEMRSGTANVSGGTIESIAEEVDIEPNAGGPSVNGGVAFAINQHTTNHPISVNITGGNFVGPNALYESDLMDDETSNISISISGGSFQGAVTSENVDGFITGGSFDSDVSEYVPDGYDCTNEGGSFQISEKTDLPPIWDDDDDYVPPIYVPSQTNDDDDTVKIVACAAAAVVAAIMAAFLVLGNKKD